MMKLCRRSGSKCIHGRLARSILVDLHRHRVRYIIKLIVVLNTCFGNLAAIFRSHPESSRRMK